MKRKCIPFFNEMSQYTICSLYRLSCILFVPSIVCPCILFVPYTVCPSTVCPYTLCPYTVCPYIVCPGTIFSYAKRIFRLPFFCAEKFKFSWKGVTKIDLQNRQVFSSNFEFCHFFFIFRNQSQVFTTTGQKYDRYMTTSKKIRPLALKCAKLERFKVKRHKFAENLPI